MLRSRLFLRLFSTVLFILGLFSSAAYLFSVPLIEEKAYEIELDASRTILDNVFELVSKIRGGLDEQRAITVEAHKVRLRNVVSLAVGYTEYVFGRMDRGEISEAEARRLVFEGLKAFKYGNDDYVWVTDYNSVLLSHPIPLSRAATLPLCATMPVRRFFPPSSPRPGARARGSILIPGNG